MPNISNLTVKKADGTTDVTYTALNPAGGDGIPAIFRSQTVGTAPAANPEVRVSSRSSKTGRVLRITAQYPKVQTISGVETVTTGAALTVEMQISSNQSATDSTEAAAQFVNILKTPLIQSCLNTGFPPV